MKKIMPSSAPRKRMSLPIAWDRTYSTVSSNGTTEDIFIEGDEDTGTDNIIHGGTGDDVVVATNNDDNAAVMNLLVEQNPSLAIVNETVANHIKEMLQDIHKKTGLSLAAMESQPPDHTQRRLRAVQVVRQVPPFSYLPVKVIQELVDHDLYQVEHSDGEVIVQQGKDDDDLYILAQGRVVMVQLRINTFGTNGSITPMTTNTIGRRNSDCLPLHNNSNGNKTQSFMDQPSSKFVGYLDAPAHFGGWGTLFDTDRSSQVIAGGTGTERTIVYRMEGKRFEQLLYDHSAFRLKLALGLRQEQGIFADIESFVALIRRAVAHDVIFDIDAILTSYRRMTPAIHVNLHSSQLDIEGWTYSIRRLPESITSTYVYLLSNHVPMPFMHSQFDLKALSVKTAARRRKAFQLDHGKLLIVVREKYSDVLDFLSLLCAHIHESEKLRTKLSLPSALNIIHTCLWQPEKSQQGSNSDEIKATAPTTLNRYQRQYRIASLEEQRVALEQLPLTQEEMKGLQSLWPEDFLYRIWDIICLHENIQIRSDLSSSYVESTDRWAESIRRAASDLLSSSSVCRPTDTNSQEDDTIFSTTAEAAAREKICLRTEITTHVISSNTTSVRNLLSPYILKKKQVIKEWGENVYPEIMDNAILSESDKLCALCNAYMKHHPNAIKEQDDFDRKCFKTLRNTELTGIQVELIDLNALEQLYIEHDIDPDPFLSTCFPRYQPGKGWLSSSTDSNNNESSLPEKNRLLVNIDYAFGKQAEQLISALCLLFDKSLSSVGVMGKAGGLQGRRGDIIVADYLVHQEGDEQTLIDNTGVDREALHTLSRRTVHSGGVLTVLGTLLQDTRLLNFYKKLYGCVSLEMEGSFYARELQRYKKAGLLCKDVNLRFLYYVSDTPLSTDQTETLSQDLSLAEVIPPQYAVTRALLYPVLSERN